MVESKMATVGEDSLSSACGEFCERAASFSSPTRQDYPVIGLTARRNPLWDIGGQDADKWRAGGFATVNDLLVAPL